jgi:L-lysine exporter family protein LysE/ArgO
MDASSWTSLLAGFALSLSLIVAIGAQNAFVLRQGLLRQHVGAVVLFCATADAALMSLGVLAASQVQSALPWLAPGMTAAGVLFLAVYGLNALRRAARDSSLQAASGPSPSLRATLAQTAAFTFLNPHVYLDTVVLVGTLGAQHGPAGRGWFLAGACLASAAWFTALGYGARRLAPWFARPQAWRWLDAGVGVTMLALAGGLAASLRASL